MRNVGAALRGRPPVSEEFKFYLHGAKAKTGCPQSGTPTGRPTLFASKGVRFHGLWKLAEGKRSL